MTFSLEQALAEYFDNSGGGGVSYGGTGMCGQITGAPTGGSAAPTGSGAGTGFVHREAALRPPRRGSGWDLGQSVHPDW